MRLVYSTYLTGYNSAGVAAYAIAVDSAGNAYVTGTMEENRFAFVMKLDSAGTLGWIQTFRGSPWAAGWGIAVDKSGYVYVTGDTLDRNFAPIVNALQPKSSKDSCTIGSAGGFSHEAFVAKFYPDGELVYSTFLGGDGSDAGRDIAADDQGNAFVVGNTTSLNFPTVNPLQADMKGKGPAPPGNCNVGNADGGDAFLAKISPNGSALLFSTYLGGSLNDLPFALAVDGSGSALFAGQTTSRDFPVKNGLQPELHGISDGFITKVNDSGRELAFSTFLGGSGEDRAAGVAVEANGNTYVTGSTTSRDFPALEPIQPFSEGSDAFALKLDATGTTLFYVTWLGGSGPDSGKAVALDAAGNACIAGETQSVDFPTLNPFQASFAGNIDAFAACIADPYAAKSVFPQFVDGQGTPSSLVLVNPSATRTASGTVHLFDRSGRPLPVVINGNMQEGKFAFKVTPLGIGIYTTGGTGDLRVGSARVSSDDVIGGTILFSGSTGSAGAGSAQMAARVVLPIESDVSRGIYTGVALANPYSSELSLTVDLLDVHGSPIESAKATVSLPASGQIARFPEELFSTGTVDFSRFRGTLRVQSPLSLSAMAIRLRQGQYATLPVTPIGGGSRNLQISHLANGEGMVSTVVLINPSPVDIARGTASFISNEGGPLALSIEGNSPSDKLAFEIPPLAAALFSTDGSGSLTTGWTEVSADRPIGGTIIFSGPDGMAGVGAAGPAARFLVPVESDSAGNVFTGVALSNPSESAVSVTLLLRDSNGAQVPDCVVEMIMRPKSHVARFVEELFKGQEIDLSLFRGTLEIRAALPIGGMALRASPGEYATLPVTPVK